MSKTAIKYTILLIVLTVLGGTIWIITRPEKPFEYARVPILMYHHFVEGDPNPGTEGEIMDIDLFEAQLRALKAAGYNAVTLNDLKDHYDNKVKLPPNPFVITIDDGYASNYTLAYPILKELNMPANINIIVWSRGMKPGFFEHFSWEEAQEMVDSGLIEIGSHTYNLHNPNLRQQVGETDEEYTERIYEDFKRSKDLIEENLGFTPNIFCYPYGIYDEISQEVVSSLGFDIHLTVNPGIVTKKSSFDELPRINARGDYTPEEFLQVIESFLIEE